mmetsp:Transcript_4655/g.10024  ORF Transcript_4655/g.10024 Transcript_4655/m.10024 type:complete len:327 (-) Transcript_4655:336-1316(-)
MLVRGQGVFLRFSLWKRPELPHAKLLLVETGFPFQRVRLHQGVFFLAERSARHIRKFGRVGRSIFRIDPPLVQVTHNPHEEELAATVEQPVLEHLSNVEERALRSQSGRQVFPRQPVTDRDHLAALPAAVAAFPRRTAAEGGELELLLGPAPHSAPPQFHPRLPVDPLGVVARHSQSRPGLERLPVNTESRLAISHELPRSARLLHLDDVVKSGRGLQLGDLERVARAVRTGVRQFHVFPRPQPRSGARPPAADAARLLRLVRSVGRVIEVAEFLAPAGMLPVHVAAVGPVEPVREVAARRHRGDAAAVVVRRGRGGRLDVDATPG